MTTGTKTVLAALGSDARPVLETALRTGEAMGAVVRAVRVGNRQVGQVGAMTGCLEVSLERLSGPADEALLAALGAPEVLAMVIGAGATRRARHPVGQTARHILERARKPVVVVPAGAVSRRPLRRLLVPLEGSQTTSRPVLDTLLPLFVADVEIVVLHVFTEATLPRMLDRPVQDLQLLGREFLAEHCPSATRIELRPAPVSARVSEVCQQHEVDMVVLSWSQDTSRGRARVVREVLTAASRPVLLLPAAARGPSWAPSPAHRAMTKNPGRGRAGGPSFP